ncbi:hypothetical protein B0H11DRAFT_1900314 [Mycena galericulata]|nr:hypothetical protein B0H11DRAFT_1900314 [Mycena galericulata]
MALFSLGRGDFWLVWSAACRLRPGSFGKVNTAPINSLFWDPTLRRNDIPGVPTESAFEVRRWVEQGITQITAGYQFLSAILAESIPGHGRQVTERDVKYTTAGIAPTLPDDRGIHGYAALGVPPFIEPTPVSLQKKLEFVSHPVALVNVQVNLFLLSPTVAGPAIYTVALNRREIP